MKKQKKQSLLTAIISLLVIVLVMMFGSIIYEEVINMNKQPTYNTSSKLETEDDKEEKINEKENPIEEENEIETEETEEIKKEDPTQKEEYIGEEEKHTQENITENKDEKAIKLVKKEWGNDDTVTFRIEKKNGSKYRVAVRDNSTTVLQWYEVDTETWEVSEY